MDIGSNEPIVDDMTHEERDEVFRMPWEGEDGEVVHNAPHLDIDPDDDGQLELWLP